MAAKITNGYLDSSRAEMERILTDLSENIGTVEWKKLVRRLEVPERFIAIIDKDFPKTQEKAFQALMKWFNMYGYTGATKDVLIKAIRSESKLLADEICTRHNIIIDSPKKELSEEHTPQPINDDNIIDDAGTLPEEVELKSLSLYGKELASLLKCSQDNLGTCDSTVLCQRQRTLKHVYNMAKIQLDRMKNFKTRKPTITDSLENAKKDCRKIIIQTEQTMLLIQHLLDGITIGRKRCQSEIPQRSRSFIDLSRLEPNRRKTFSSVSTNDEISSPIFVRKKEKALS